MRKSTCVPVSLDRNSSLRTFAKFLRRYEAYGEGARWNQMSFVNVAVLIDDRSEFVSREVTVKQILKYSHCQRFRLTLAVRRSGFINRLNKAVFTAYIT